MLKRKLNQAMRLYHGFVAGGSLEEESELGGIVGGEIVAGGMMGALLKMVVRN